MPKLGAGGQQKTPLKHKDQMAVKTKAQLATSCWSSSRDGLLWSVCVFVGGQAPF